MNKNGSTVFNDSTCPGKCYPDKKNPSRLGRVYNDLGVLRLPPHVASNRN